MWNNWLSGTRKMPPKAAAVSVVVPLYNHQQYVAEALESVLAQSLPAKEIIVVDDGSQDDSAAIARRYAGNDPRIKVWQHPNQGAHYTINTGIHLASEEYVAILNSDDAYLPHRLQECVAFLADRPEVGAVASGLQFMDDASRAIKNPWYEEALAFRREAGDLALALANGNFVMTTSNLVIRRSVFQEIGYFCALRYAHDLDFFLRLLLAGKSFEILDAPLLRYRLHATNTIKENAVKVRAEWAAVVSFFAYALMARRERGAAVWSYRRRLVDIAERHRLSGLVLLFLNYFAQLPPGQVSSDAFLRDPDFLSQVLDAAR